MELRIVEGIHRQTVVGVPALVPILFQADPKDEPSLDNKKESVVTV